MQRRGALRLEQRLHRVTHAVVIRLELIMAPVADQLASCKPRQIAIAEWTGGLAQRLLLDRACQAHDLEQAAIPVAQIGDTSRDGFFEPRLRSPTRPGGAAPSG